MVINAQLILAITIVYCRLHKVIVKKQLSNRRQDAIWLPFIWLTFTQLGLPLMWEAKRGWVAFRLEVSTCSGLRALNGHLFVCLPPGPKVAIRWLSCPLHFRALVCPLSAYPNMITSVSGSAGGVCGWHHQPYRTPPIL